MRILVYYQCLLTFCFHELDVLVQQDDALLNLRYGQLYPLEQLPPKNRAIDEISEEFAYTFTRFTKDQLRILFLHLRIPQVIIIPNHHRFTGEEVLIISLARLATGDPWTRLIPGNFGGNVRRWSAAFRWFIEHIFITFYHKISGSSIEMWIADIFNFKQAILDRLAQPAHPIEIEYFEEEGIDFDREEFVIHCPLDAWRVFGFLDDTAVRTCRPGSGPVGDDDGPGRPRRRFANMIQRAFYR